MFCYIRCLSVAVSNIDAFMFQLYLKCLNLDGLNLD